MVLLYSRLNSLISVFTFRFSSTTGHATSQCDPYLLPLDKTLLSSPSTPQLCIGTRSKYGILCLQLKLVPIVKDVLAEHDDLYENARYYQLRVLCSDLCFSEQLYIQSAASSAMQLDSPDISTRSGGPKTPARVVDDFIVPDGVVDDADSYLNPPLVVDKVQPQLMRPSEDLRTIDMGWLVNAISDYSLISSVPKHKKFREPVHFVDYLLHIQAAVEARSSTCMCGIDTM